MATFPPSYPTHHSASANLPFRPLQPYLGPQAHLSLSWISQVFLSLLLVFIALLFLLSSLDSLVEDGKQSLANSCSGVESAANVMVSMPHYFADGVNRLNQKSVEAVVSGTATALDLTLQGILAIVLFVIDLYRSLFLCLLDLVVHGSRDLLISATEEFSDFVTDAFQTVRTELQNAVGVINSGLNATLGVIDDIPGVNFDIPQIGVPSLDNLNNVTLPSGILDGLTSLNDSIPTLDELKSSLNSLISTPVNQLRAEINSTLSNATISVEQLPVPAKETVDLCSDLDTSFLDTVGHDLAKAVKISLGLIALAAALFIFVSALYERRRYAAYLEGVARARDAWLADLGHPHPPGVSAAEDTLSTPNLLSFLSAAEHPTLSHLFARLSNSLRLTPQRRASVLWFGSYIFHPAPLAFLALGLVGLLVVQIQLAALNGPIRSLAQSRANEGAGQFAGSVSSTVNGKMNDTSSEWARRSNEVIVGLQDKVNDDLFGWVNGTTVAINSTINGFYDEVESSITGVFNGTVLESPMLGLIYCLIGSKVDAISTALTWMHDNSHITLPTVGSDCLLVSPNSTAELSESMSNPNSTVSAPSLVNRMIDSYAKSLEQQRLGFIICLIIWGIVVVMGLVGVWWRERGEEWWAGKRGHRRGPPSFSEKDTPAFRPFHLGSKASTTSLPKPEYANFPSPPLLAPPPPIAAARRNSNASWLSLIDFFRHPLPPTTPTAPYTPPKHSKRTIPPLPKWDEVASRLKPSPRRPPPLPLQSSNFSTHNLLFRPMASSSTTDLADSSKQPRDGTWQPLASPVFPSQAVAGRDARTDPFADPVRRPIGVGSVLEHPYGARGEENGSSQGRGRVINPFATPFDGPGEQ